MSMSSWRSAKLLPWLVLGLGLLCAAGAGYRQQQANAGFVEERFQAMMQRAVSQVRDRMTLYEYGLRGTRGAVVAAGGRAVTRERFARYAASRNPAKEFPGARGFGFVRKVPRAQEPAFVEAARADGWPAFSIRQLAPHDGDRYVIQYVEPVASNRDAIGLDIASEAQRREAAERAVRSGEQVLTGPVTLVQAAAQPHSAFLLLLAVYEGGATPPTEAAREAAVIGWAYTPLVIDEVLRDFDYGDGRFRIALYDRTEGAPPEPFFATPGWAGQRGRTGVKEAETWVFGRRWAVQVQATPTFYAYLNLPSPWTVAGGTAAGALLLAGLTYLYLLGIGRARAESLQRARMAAIVEHSPDAIIGQTLDGVVQEWNPAAQRMFGYSAGEAVGRTVRELIVPPDRDAEETEILQRVGRGLGVPGFDTVRCHRDGHAIDVSVSVAPIRLDGGEVVGTAKILRDISAQKAAEAEILQLNATLEQQVAQRTAEVQRLAARERAILASAGSAVIATDSAGLVMVFNPAAEALLGYRADEVVGKVRALSFHDPEELRQRCLKPGEDRPVRVEDLMGGMARDGGSVRGEWTYVRRDGTRLPVLLVLSELRDEAGTQIGFMGVATDLSERARLQRELIDLNRALTERSAQAEAATRAKSEFLANMSHEIRTPMNAIVGLTELMRRDTRDPVLRDRLDKMADASRLLLAIINNVLDLSKIEAGRLVLEQVEFDLQQVLENTCALVLGQVRGKPLELVIDAARAPRRLVGDPTRLGQALLNLLGNAVKFTPAGHVVVRCRQVDGAPGRITLRFEVADTGIGIAAPALQHLFQAFEQADASTTRRYGGTGLGLTITRQLAELMGGKVGASSREGRGSTFWFTVQLAPGHPVPAHDAVLAGRRALVVDDTLVAAEAIAGAMEALGGSVDIAGAAGEAVALLYEARARGQPYDLLVWDADTAPLPPAARETPGLAVLLTTMRDGSALRVSLHRVPGILVLEKPLTGAALERAAAAVLGAGTATGLSALPGEPDLPHFDGVRALLAEDNVVNQLVAVEQLRALGLEVDVVSTGAEAVQRARAQRYDIILMDLHMPEMDGLEATREIRRLPDHADTPILAMTASAFGEDRSASLEAGMDDHISKPVETRVLVRTLERWLRPQLPAPRRPGPPGGRS